MAEHARGAENGRSKSRDKKINLLENEDEELQELNMYIFCAGSRPPGLGLSPLNPKTPVTPYR